MSGASAPPVFSAHTNETLLFFTLLELAVIVIAGRVSGALARRLGQAPVVGEIVVGIVLGPSLLGWIAPGGSISFSALRRLSHWRFSRVWDLCS